MDPALVVGWTIAGLSVIGAVGIPLWKSRNENRLNEQQINDLVDQRNSQLRQQWQDATLDVDYLWGFLQNEILPWAREMYTAAEAAKMPGVRKPPILKPRPRREYVGEESTARFTDK